MLSVLGIVFVSLLAMGGAASAQPAVAYPPTPPPTVIINVNITIINNGTIIIFSGGGFDSLEDILISAFNTGIPSGLRSSPALSQMAAATISTTADAAGEFSVDVASLITAPGVWEVTATGLTSGKSGTATVTKVAAAGGPAYVTGGGGSSGSSYSSSDALASTGASVAGPIAIGAAALIAGLAMLFFGTRGVIRRKSSRSGGTA